MEDDKLWKLGILDGRLLSNLTPESKERILIGVAEAEHNLVQIFDEREVLGKQFCMYGSPDEPLFLAKDVAAWIDYDTNKVGQMLSTIEEEEKFTSPIFYSGQVREMWFVTEDGLYEILMQSRKPIAKEFKQKVKEILKSVRKQGYFLAKPLTQLEVLAQTTQVLLQQEKQIKRIEDQIQGIRDIVALTPFDNWRDSTRTLINKIVEASGYDYDKVRSESYKLLNTRLCISLIRRLKNRQKTALLNGATKSSAEQINYLDVIAEDKKLIEGYVAIVKDMAIKYGE